MFTAKILQKMTPHELPSGEQCVNVDIWDNHLVFFTTVGLQPN